MQSEYGDLYKVTVTSDAADKGRVVELKVKYFDTLPACSSICVLRTGFLFAASEFGNHALYQFQVQPVACTCSADHTPSSDFTLAQHYRALQFWLRHFKTIAVHVLYMLCTLATCCAYNLHAVSALATCCNESIARVWWHDFPAVIQGQLD